ncbi:MAG: phenylalanine--tRNA ligase subunit beta [Bacteroidales bacterium]
MKISYNWLKQYVDFEYSPQQLSEILTNTGLEIGSLEKFESVKGSLEGVVVGEVITCKKHLNADKLSVTTVDVGENQPLPIVCGAPNVDEGQKVLVAKVGATLYPEEDKPFPIKKTKIRGETSEGMICAEDELGLGASHEGIMVLDDDKQVGQPASKYFNVEEDWTLEIDLTPNRADATSHIGVARDVIAVINRMEKEKKVDLKIPDIAEFHVDTNELQIPVEIEDPEACPRYSAITIKDIKVGESPEWLKNRLKAAGIRPVNNVVDATNFIMLETGHPLHPFDADHIEGGKVVIKKLNEGTAFNTLDGVERKLSSEDLMICDARNPMCIAGVFGGMNSGVKQETTSLFLESAYFNPTSIRKTSKRHQLKTDASFRYERGADPNITLFALKRAAMLIKEVAGGRIASEVIDENPGNLKPWEVELHYEKLDKLAGMHIDRPLVIRILSDLGMEILEESVEKVKMLVPTFKVDVKRDVDVIEEVMRIYGYNYIPLPEKMQISLSHAQKPDRDHLTNMISDFLSSNGFLETMNNSLTAYQNSNLSENIDSAQFVHILNPLSRELNVMRQDLLVGGLQTISYNINRQNKDLMFYEIGKVYHFNPQSNKNQDVRKRYSENHRLGIFLTGKKYKESWNKPGDIFDLYDAKYWVHNVLTRMGVQSEKLQTKSCSRDYFSEGLLYKNGKSEIVQFGKVSRKLLQKFDIEQDVFYVDIAWDRLIAMTGEAEIAYKPLPKYPEVRRDLAMILDKGVRFEDIKQLAYEKERKTLKSVRLFDVYEGKNVPEGKKSYAVSFILQDPNKTLTDKLIDKTMSKLQQAFEQKLNAEIRG